MTKYEWKKWKNMMIKQTKMKYLVCLICLFILGSNTPLLYGGEYTYLLRVKSNSLHATRVSTNDYKLLFNEGLNMSQDTIYLARPYISISIFQNLLNDYEFNIINLMKKDSAANTDKGKEDLIYPYYYNFFGYEKIPYFQQKTIHSSLNIFDTIFYKRAAQISFVKGNIIAKLYDIKSGKVLHVFQDNTKYSGPLIPYFIEMDKVVYEMNEQILQLIAINIDYWIREILNIRYDVVDNVFYHGAEGINYDPNFRY